MLGGNMSNNLEKLPALCALHHITTGKPVIVKRGEMGYYPQEDDFDVDFFNEVHGITENQKMCMQIGSMYGFHVPGADPDCDWTKVN
jgi:hypothetical protein